MNRLIGDLLDLAKLEAHQELPVELAKRDVVELAREVADAFEPIASVSKLALVTSLPDQALYASCDGDRVVQVLDNLVGNAIKFTRAGGTIRIGLRRDAGEIVVSVSDTGAGIPEHELPFIFEPYWQASEKSRRGVGLGLAVVKAIAMAHHGRIWVETAIGVGTTFHFALPAATATPARGLHAR